MILDLTILAVAFAASVLLYPTLIRGFQRLRVRQPIQAELSSEHQRKKGTPTGGGILFVAVGVLGGLLATRNHPGALAPTVALALYGALGLFDDMAKLRFGSIGIPARLKFPLQVLVAIPIVALATVQQHPIRFDMIHQWYYWPLAIAAVVGAANSVNLTDGLDGLAIGCTVISAGALTVLTYVSGHAKFADYLELQSMPQVAEVTIFCGAMVGASIGFLWYNAHPAEIFMGDVGSLALGGAIATVAVIIKQELLLPFIGGIFVIEAFSVILQVGSYKLRKKRIFKMAPIHHHFELVGWSESKIIIRFWIASLVFALFALTTLKLR